MILRTPLKDCTGSSIFCDPPAIYGPAEFLLSLLRDNVLHFDLLPFYLTSHVLTQQYSHHGSFHSPLCRNQPLFFLLHSSPCFTYNILIYMYIYMCVCMCVGVRVGVCVWREGQGHAHTHTRTHTHTHTYIIYNKWHIYI